MAGISVQEAMDQSNIKNKARIKTWMKWHRDDHKVVQLIMQKIGWQYRVKVKKRKQTSQPYHIAGNFTDITYLPYSR